MIPRKKRLERKTRLQAKKSDSLKRRNRMRQVSKRSGAKYAKYQRIRKKAAIRAGERCERCGRHAPLTGHPLEVGNFHHKRYRSHGGKDSLFNAEWLCGECHRIEHEGLKPVPKKPEGSRRDYVPTGAEAGA